MIMNNKKVEQIKLESDLRTEYFSLVEQDERLIKLIDQLKEQRKELNKKIKKQELLIKNNKKNRI